MKHDSILVKYAEKIEKELKNQIKPEEVESEPMYAMMRYFFGWQDENGNAIDDAKARGKRFRPSLCLLVNESLNGKWEKALPAAVALELFHNFTLIHDDIEDHDEFRRHKPTVWKIWGIEQAINAGDGMYILFLRACLALRKNGYKESVILACIEAMQQTFQKIIEGQYMDISFENRSNVNVSEYIKMTESKTSVLVACACKVGALLAINDKKAIEEFYDFGLDFGMAYQIYDDWCGIWEKTEKTGKEIAGDIKKKKKTLPVLYAFENLLNGDKAELSRIYQKNELSKEDVKKAIELISKSGAQEYTAKIFENYKKRAKNIIETLSIKKSFKNEFNGLIEKLIKA